MLPDSSTQTEHRRVGMVFDAKETSWAETTASGAENQQSATQGKPAEGLIYH